MTAVVCDASVLFKLLVPEEHSEHAFKLAENNQLIAPEFVWLEIGNALWRRARAGVIDARFAPRLLEQLNRFDLDIRSVRDFAAPGLRLALLLAHPIYDCVYLAMADALKVRLVTADRRLLAALRGGVPGSVQVNVLSDFA
jgi:predicted nucleic acid-binding protein